MDFDRFCDAIRAWQQRAAALAQELRQLKADLTDLEKAVADYQVNIIRIDVSPPLSPD